MHIPHRCGPNGYVALIQGWYVYWLIALTLDEICCMLIGRSCINSSYTEDIGALYLLEVGECERSNRPQVRRSE